jgi:hypothetical protein
MRKVFSILAIFVLTAIAAGISSCSAATATGTNTIDTPPASTVPVSLTMTDDPPAGVSVLFFQVTLTAASLQPTSGAPVSLLANNTPIQVDVTQLQALSAFLSTVNVPAGSYSSLSLTFANPQLTIMNNSDTSIASTCAVGSVCQLTPNIDNSATIALSTQPFPITVAANSPFGFLVDFHLNTIIQSDLSVNLGAANGVSVSPLQPPTSPTAVPRFGALLGSITAVNASLNQFTLKTPDGRPFTIVTSTSTTYDDFPASACTAAGFSCLAQGEIVRVQVSSLQSGGVLMAGEVTYTQAAGQQTVVGTIVGIPALPLPAGETIILLMLHQNPTAAASLPPGAMASVALWAGTTSATTYSIDAHGFTIPSGYTFSSVQDLMIGQTVQVTVTPGSLQAPTVSPTAAGWGPPAEPSFAASSVQLEPGQITGSIAAIAPASSSFTLNYIYAPVPMANVVRLIQFDVQTTAQTTYQGFTTDSFSGLADDDWISVNGWLFPASSSASLPVIVPQTVVQHPSGLI